MAAEGKKDLRPMRKGRHKCAAKKCSVEVPLRMLMCIKHWRMVPQALQREVWKHYSEGQEKVGIEATSQQYRDAVANAVAAVEART